MEHTQYVPVNTPCPSTQWVVQPCAPNTASEKRREVMLVYPFLKLNFQWVSVFVHMGYRDCTRLSIKNNKKNFKGVQPSIYCTDL